MNGSVSTDESRNVATNNPPPPIVATIATSQCGILIGFMSQQILDETG